jgi:uncharacterized membrane protein
VLLGLKGKSHDHTIKFFPRKTYIFIVLWIVFQLAIAWNLHRRTNVCSQTGNVKRGKKEVSYTRNLREVSFGKFVWTI